MKVSDWKRWLVTVGGVEFVLTEEAARPRLCDATGLHDPRPDGICRDCGKTLTEADQACRSEP